MKIPMGITALSLLLAMAACRGAPVTVEVPADTPTGQVITPTPTERRPITTLAPTEIPATQQAQVATIHAQIPSPTAPSRSDVIRLPTKTPLITPSATTTQIPLDVPLRGSGVFEPISSAANAEMRLGRAALESGDLEKALAHYQKAADLQGEPSAVINNWIAITYRRMGLYDLSIAHYSQAIALNDQSLLRAGRAFVYWHNGQCPEAIEDAETALTMTPVVAAGAHSHAEAHTVLSWCYYDMGQPRKELEHLRAALPLIEEHGYSEQAIRSVQEEIELILEELGDR